VTFRPPGGRGGRSPRRPLLLLALLGTGEIALLSILGRVPGARATPFPAVLLWGAAFALYLAAARLLARESGGRSAARGPDPRIRPGSWSGIWGVIWGVAVAGRLILLPLTPHFSDDIYRYLWDGWIHLQGIDPFLHPPAAAALEPLRTVWHGLVNHPEVPTIYPPGAQAAFLLLAAVGPSVVLFKGAWVAADLALGWLLARAGAGGVGRTGEPGTGDRPPGAEGRPVRPAGALAALLWLWSPLVLVEVSWSGHLDPLALLPTVGALLLLRRERAREAGRARGPDRAADPEGSRETPGRRDLRPDLAGGLLGLGGAIKFAPLVALPALWRRRSGRAALVGMAVTALFYLPHLDAGGRVFGGLTTYAERWRFNAGAFELLSALLDPAVARLVGAAVVGGLALRAALGRWSVERTLWWCVGAALLLSPTLHPWYALWILPLAALRHEVAPDAARAWILWTGLLFLAYAGLDAYRATGVWPHPASLSWLIHLPLLALLARAGWRSRWRAGR